MPNIPQGLRAAAAAALLIVPLTGCESPQRVAEAVRIEARTEQERVAAEGERDEAQDILDNALELPDEAPDRDGLVARAEQNLARAEAEAARLLAMEREWEAEVKSRQAASRQFWIDTGLDTVTDVVGGQPQEGVAGLGLALIALATWYVRKRTGAAQEVAKAADGKAEEVRSKLEADNDTLRRELQDAIAENNRVRDESRAVQGVAPASARSADAAKSRVARAVEAAEQAGIKSQVDAALAPYLAQFTPQVHTAPNTGGPMTPAPPAARTSGPEQWSAGVGVPPWPENPGPVPGGEA